MVRTVVPGNGAARASSQTVSSDAQPRLFPLSEMARRISAGRSGYWSDARLWCCSGNVVHYHQPADYPAFAVTHHERGGHRLSVDVIAGLYGLHGDHHVTRHHLAVPARAFGYLPAQFALSVLYGSGFCQCQAHASAGQRRTLLSLR